MGKLIYFGFWLATPLLGVSLVMPACSSGPVAADNDGASIVVGPGGGTLTTGNGVVVDVPAGAVDHDVIITVTARAAPSGYAVDGEAYHFEPAGLHFAQPLTIPFPKATANESVYWSLDGDEERFEPLPTTLGNGHAVAHPTHFSSGFVGAAQGVTCTMRRHPAGSCFVAPTTESNVAFSLAFDHGDPDGAIATTSSAIRALYNAETGAPVYFPAADGTHTLYSGHFAEAITRSGTSITVEVHGARGASSQPGCDIPLIAVDCSGSTTLGGSVEPPPDAGVSGDDDASDASEPDASDANDDSTDVDANDAAVDVDASDAAPGAEADAGDSGIPAPVTCVVRKRTDNPDGTCTPATTTQPGGFYTTLYNADPGGAIATDSSAFLSLYNVAVPPLIVFVTDPTHLSYGPLSSDPFESHLVRTGNYVAIDFHGWRGSSFRPECTLPTIDVVCTGSLFVGPPLAP